MRTSRTDKLLAILQEYFTSREEGWLWLATYRDDCEQGVVNQIEGAYEDVPATAAALGHIINGCSADRTYLALCRSEGRPTEADRELWRDLRGRVTPESLLDMVVFNQSETWSMRTEDAAAAI
jgi:hypothetical protein